MIILNSIISWGYYIDIFYFRPPYLFLLFYYLPWFPNSLITLKQITADRVVLYSQVPPPGDSIPVEIDPFEVEDGVPDEGEIEWAVKRLYNNRAGGGVADAGGEPKGMARGGTERGEGGNRGQRRERPGGHTREGGELGKGSGVGYRRPSGMEIWPRRRLGRR